MPHLPSSKVSSKNLYLAVEVVAAEEDLEVEEEEATIEGVEVVALVATAEVVVSVEIVEVATEEVVVLVEIVEVAFTEMILEDLLQVISDLITMLLHRSVDPKRRILRRQRAVTSQNAA